MFITALAPPDCLLQKIWIYPAARQRKDVPADGRYCVVGVVICSSFFGWKSDGRFYVEKAMAG